MKFNELSEEAKDRAREDAYDLDHDWWDHTEDAVRMANIIGIQIDWEGKRAETPAINFSGFSSQGDGACFRGSYEFDPDAVANIKAECPIDTTLHNITEQLSLIFVTRRLKGIEHGFNTKITTSGREYHSYAMDVELDSHGEEDDAYFIEVQDTILTLMRTFADWMYKQLEQEYEYLTSDERLAEEEFDETDAVI